MYHYYVCVLIQKVTEFRLFIKRTGYRERGKDSDQAFSREITVKVKTSTDEGTFYCAVEVDLFSAVPDQ